MENNNQENPWIKKIESFNISFDDDNLNSIFIAKINFLNNLPYLFNKIDDIVSCDVCNRLFSKNASLKHAKIHEKSKKSDNFTCFPSIIDKNNDFLPESIINIRRNNKSIIKNNKILHKDDKKRKIKTENNINLKLIAKNSKILFPINENQYLNNNFVPKSTLNAANPLRIKIQLQPKIDNPSKNGNIFDNLKTLFPNTNLMEKDSISLINDCIIDTKQQVNKVITIQKYASKSLTNNRETVKINNGAAIQTAIRNQYVNQTSSLPPVSRTKHSLHSPQLSQLPRVFQTSFRREMNNNGKIVRKKYVEVKSLGESRLLPLSSSSSSSSRQNHNSTVISNLDENQISFQKILIDNGMFSKEDILRCQKPNSAIDFSHLSKMRKFSNVRFVQKNTLETSILQSEGNPRLLNLNGCSMRPLSQGGRTNIMVTKTNPPVVSQCAQLNNKNHNTHHYESMDLSDDEFCLDSSFTNNRRAVHKSASSANISCQHTQPHYEPPGTSASCSSNVYKDLLHQSSSQRSDHRDTGVHYLPPPEETITSLSWEQ